MPAENVLVLGEIAHHVEVAKAIELPYELAPSHPIVIRLAGGAPNRRKDRGAQIFVGPEVGDPVDELFLERLSSCDRLVAAISVAARRTEVAPYGRP
ncbi:MAG TPA: hypothetical protein VFA88_02055 [Gaiellaceae bacterium]|nr:hypothetical protein [Gaiellaceae bacterium]